jgi:hypothetical protein
MDLEPHETTLQKTGLFTFNCTYYRRLLKQEIPGNPIIMSVEEIDAAITISISKIRSEKERL